MPQLISLKNSAKALTRALLPQSYGRALPECFITVERQLYHFNTLPGVSSGLVSSIDAEADAGSW